MKITYSSAARGLQALLLPALAMLAAMLAVRGSAGIQGSGFQAMAAIGIVGSTSPETITVGGTVYSISDASVSVDGTPGSFLELSPGHVVAVQGLEQSGQKTVQANSIVLNGNVRGAITAVDSATGSFQIEGQTVVVDSSTIFDPLLAVASLIGLNVGTSVEVSGFEQADGSILASRIDLSPAQRPAQIVGTVQSLDVTQQTFRLNALTVHYASAQVSGDVIDGARVRVQGQLSADNTLRASAVAIVPGLAGQAGTDGEVQGLITALSASTYFIVEGQPIAVSANTKQILQVPLGLDVFVKVRGTFDANGVLQAQKLHSKSKPAH